MIERNCCRGCGLTRPADAPSGLCPACLLKAGLLGEGSHLPDLTITFGPASTSVLARFGEAFGQIPPVLLRDVDSINDPGPVIRPSSPEVPEPSERSARLQLFGEIARGGMGAVLKGRDSDLGRDLAVKVLLESHRDKPEMVRRFIEEAQIAGQLQHPGIVPIYELGAFGDRRPYFAMKLVKGHTLAEILASRKSPTDNLPRFLSIFESICQTMAYAHARGVIHRDLKPSNVMVGSFGEVQVMDWGLAKVLPRGGVVDDASAGHSKDQGTIIATARSGSDADLSQPGSIMGTPSYMAPEQARGEVDQVDERSDVFALGSIFCELLTGEPAFTGRNPGEIQRKAARGELAEASARLDDQSHDPELIALARSCLASERDDRPRNAGEVAERMSLYHAQVQDRLRQAEISGAEEKARAEEATKRVAVERQRLRLTVALAASVLGLILLGGGGWTYLATQKAALRAATEQQVSKELDKAKLLWGKAQAAAIGDLTAWSEALASAETARKLLDAAVEADPELRASVVKLQTDLEAERTAAVERSVEANRDGKLIDRLEAARRVELKNEYERPSHMNATYATAFREFGIDLDQLEPIEAGRRLAKRLRSKELAYYLDDWALIRSGFGSDEEKGANERSWGRLIQAASLGDPDPWRNKLRSLIGRKDPEAVDRLAADEKNWTAQPPRSLLLLAQLLRAHERGEVAEDILKTAWRLRPDDFLICLELGTTSKEESLRFLTAAVALNPDRTWVRYRLVNYFIEKLGNRTSLNNSMCEVWIGPPRRRPKVHYEFINSWGILSDTTTVDDLSEIDPKTKKALLAEMRSVVRLAPDVASLHMELAQMILAIEGKPDEAMKEYREAFRLDPNNAEFHHLAATDLAMTGGFQYEEASEPVKTEAVQRAIAELEEAIRINPKVDYYYAFLGCLHEHQSRPDLAFVAYRQYYLLQDKGSDSRSFILLKLTGTPEQVIDTLQERMRLKPDDLFNLLSLGEILQSAGRVDEAISLFKELIGRKTEGSAVYHYGLSVALKAKGDVVGSDLAYREAVRRKSELLAKLMENEGERLELKGKDIEAIAPYRRASEFAPPGSEQAKDIAEKLRRLEQKAELAARLPLILKGEDKPRDTAETLALANYCYEKERYATSARFWQDGFAADPSLANACEHQNRYNAACAAALAGCGKGKDEIQPDSAAREKLRDQAREWLRSVLRLYAQQSGTETDGVRKEVVDRMTHWKQDADLAGVRDPEALARLPETERKGWQALWADVDILMTRSESPTSKP